MSDTTEQRFRSSKQTCACFVQLWSSLNHKQYFSINQNSSIQCSAIIPLTALVNTSIYYRLLWQLLSRLLGKKKKKRTKFNPFKIWTELFTFLHAAVLHPSSKTSQKYLTLQDIWQGMSKATRASIAIEVTKGRLRKTWACCWMEHRRWKRLRYSMSSLTQTSLKPLSLEPFIYNKYKGIIKDSTTLTCLKSKLAQGIIK